MKWTAPRGVLMGQLSKTQNNDTLTQGLLAPLNLNRFGAMRVEDTLPTNVYDTRLFDVFDDPAINVAASITQAAGLAGVSNVCRSITASISAGATASGIVKVVLRDGATGVGPALWVCNLVVGILGNAVIGLTGLQIEGTPATEMTLEFTVAGGATTQETVAMSGYIVDEG